MGVVFAIGRPVPARGPRAAASWPQARRPGDGPAGAARQVPSL